MVSRGAEEAGLSAFWVSVGVSVHWPSLKLWRFPEGFQEFFLFRKSSETRSTKELLLECCKPYNLNPKPYTGFGLT